MIKTTNKRKIRHTRYHQRQNKSRPVHRHQRRKQKASHQLHIKKCGIPTNARTLTTYQRQKRNCGELTTYQKMRHTNDKNRRGMPTARGYLGCYNSDRKKAAAYRRQNKLRHTNDNGDEGEKENDNETLTSVSSFTANGPSSCHTRVTLPYFPVPSVLSHLRSRLFLRLERSHVRARYVAWRAMGKHRMARRASTRLPLTTPDSSRAAHLAKAAENDEAFFPSACPPPPPTHDACPYS